ncbi:MAG: IS982 family transposase ISWpi16 [Holosporales bacterium]
MKKDITELFVYIDDYCKQYDNFKRSHSLSDKGYRKPTREPSLSISEIMTIILLFHQSSCTNFKHFYFLHLPLYREDFPTMLSYQRFVELVSRTLDYFFVLIQLICAISQKTGITYIDSTCIPVFNNKRTSRHKVFKELAKLGKSTMGWFFGFKLHLVINEKGQLLACDLTPGNVDDRKPVRNMVKSLSGLLLGDKGYIDSSLFKDLYENGLKLVTGIKKNMKNILMNVKEKILLRKRSILETVNGALKTDFNLVHTRHRSPTNAFVHIFSTLVAYSLKSKNQLSNGMI